MPSILSHPAVPLALGFALGARIIPVRLLIAGAVASIVPDVDVVAFKLGIPYAHDFGHRGASHSITFAILLGALACTMAATLRASRLATFLFVAAGTLSHGLLDMLTTGGLGIALAWPFSDARLFFPVQVIQVSPIGIRRFLSEAGLRTIASELLWIWLPALVIGLSGWLVHRKKPIKAPAGAANP